MDSGYSISLISLLKGVVYDYQKHVWENVLQYEADIKKYFLLVGLELYVDKSEGYAYLRQKEWEIEDDALPRLTERRQLNFFTTLLCVILRKYLLEQDAQGGSLRTIINEAEIINRVKLFLPAATDEVKQQDKVHTTINKIIDIGFLRKLDDQERNYEIHRIIKGFVNAEVIDDTLKRLQQHAEDKQITE